MSRTDLELELCNCILRQDNVSHRAAVVQGFQASNNVQQAARIGSSRITSIRCYSFVDFDETALCAVGSEEFLSYARFDRAEIATADQLCRMILLQLMRVTA